VRINILYCNVTHSSFRHVTPASRTVCGPSAVEAVAAEADRAGSARIVVVCGRSIAREGAILDRVATALGSRLAAVFDRVEEHSPIPAVQTARETLADADADGVLTVGGGSAIVTARAASILLAEQRDVRDLCTTRGEDGRLNSPRLAAPKLPQWIVPTTPTTAMAKAGSAVRDPETGDRLALFDPKTRATAVFIDPAACATAPFAVAVGAALSAFAMAIEGLAGPIDPLAEAQLAYAVSTFVNLLPRLHADSDDDVRVGLAVAALLAGQGSDFAAGGVAQALSHAAGPLSSTSNGHVHAVLLGEVLTWGAASSFEGIDRVARALGIEPDPAAISEAVRDLLWVLSLPDRLRDMGISADDRPAIVARSQDDFLLAASPGRPTADELHALLDATW
jgi:alcohol dehydrogenase class IV